MSLERAIAESKTLEGWHYTNVSALAALRFSDDPAGSVSDLAVASDGPRLVFVNGRFAESLSRTAVDRATLSAVSPRRGSAKDKDPVGSPAAADGARSDGARAMALFPLDAGHAIGSASAKGTGLAGPFARLDGSDEVATVVVPAKTALGLVLEVVHFTDARKGAALSLPRTRIVVEDGAQATVIERYLGVGGDALTASVTEIVLGQGAQLQHVKWLDPKSYHLGTTAVTLGRDASWRGTVLGFSGRIARSETQVVLAQGASVQFDALSLARGDEVMDLATLIDHREPHAQSRQLVKGVVAGKGQSNFDGRIRVAKNAVKTDSAQSNKTLLLSKDATAVSKPHLEIFADDVKCAHGSTSGELSDDALFYLRARGIPEAEAQALLAYGFAREVVERIGEPSVRAEAETALQTWLSEVNA